MTVIIMYYLFYSIFYNIKTMSLDTLRKGLWDINKIIEEWRSWGIIVRIIILAFYYNIFYFK